MATTYEQVMERVSYALIEVIVNNTITSISGANPGVTTFTPSSMMGIYVGAFLILDVGASQEVITISSTTAITFTATTVNSHSLGVALVGATFPSGQTDAPLFTQQEIIGYINDAQTDFLTAVRPLYEVVTVPVSTGQRYYTQPADCIRLERIAINPSTTGAAGFTQLASDNFTRANENPLSQGGNWSLGTGGFVPLQLLGNLVEGSALGFDCFETYTGVGFPYNNYAQITVGSI